MAQIQACSQVLQKGGLWDPGWGWVQEGGSHLPHEAQKLSEYAGIWKYKNGHGNNFAL